MEHPTSRSTRLALSVLGSLANSTHFVQEVIPRSISRGIRVFALAAVIFSFVVPGHAQTEEAASSDTAADPASAHPAPEPQEEAPPTDAVPATEAAAPSASAPGAPASGAVSVRFVARAGKNFTVTTEGGASCQTPCQLDLQPGPANLTISGDRSFVTTISVPSRESTFLVKTKSTGVAMTGLVFAAVGTAGIFISMAANPDGVSAGPLFAFAGVSGVGFVLLLSAGKNKLKLEDSPNPQVSFDAAPLPGGGVAALSLRF